MEAFTDMIQCPICLETFTDPRMLPCIHNFCLKCLQETVLKMDEQQPKNKLRCPICRTEFVIPQQGVEGFQKNFFMQRLIEMPVAKITKTPDKSCDMCLESKEHDDDDVLQAEVYCIECRKNICRRCNKIHKNVAALKEHQLVPLGSSVENVDISFKQELKDVLSQAEACLKEWLRKLQQITEKKTNFQTNVNNIEQRVIDRKNELNALIDKCAQSLLQELASKRQTRLKEIQNEMDENERQRVIIESFKAYCQQIEAKGTNMELCQVVPTLKRRAEEIQQTHRTLSQQPTQVIQLDFEQAIFEEFLKGENAIGRLKDSIQSSEKLDISSSSPVSTVAVATSFIRSRGMLDIPVNTRVCGATKLENKIYVLCKEPNAIRIFRDQDSLDFTMQINLKQIENPWDVVSSEKSNCLYVIERINQNIWKVTPDGRQVSQWLTTSSAGRGPGLLSVTSEDHILVTTYGKPCELKIFSSKADLVRCVPLPNAIIDLQNTIQKPNGEFLITHRQTPLIGLSLLISRLSSDGKKVISRFHPKGETQKLKEPLYFALDSDNDRLFVADSGNNRVILFDSSSLNLIKVILTKKENGINFPSGLFYDGKQKQLIVRHTTNRIELFEVA